MALTARMLSDRPEELQAWDRFVDASPDGTIFHLLAWKRVVEETFHHTPRYLVAADQDEIKGILPLFEVRGLLTGRVLVSTPYAVYGGLCGTDQGATDALVAASTLTSASPVFTPIRTSTPWSTAQSQLPSNSVCAVIDINPIDTQMLMSAELSFVLCALEALLGAAPDHAPKDRRLTEIDWALSRRLFGTMLGQLSLIWKDVAEVELALGALEGTTENAQVAPFSEPTLSLTVEARIARTSSTLSPRSSSSPCEASPGERRSSGSRIRTTAPLSRTR